MRGSLEVGRAIYCSISGEDQFPNFELGNRVAVVSGVSNQVEPEIGLAFYDLSLRVQESKKEKVQSSDSYLIYHNRQMTSGTRGSHTDTALPPSSFCSTR